MATILVVDSDLPRIAEGLTIIGDVPEPWDILDDQIAGWARFSPPELVRTVRIEYEASLIDGPGQWVWPTTVWIPPRGDVDSLGQLVTHVRSARIAAQVYLSGTHHRGQDHRAQAIEATATAFLRLLGRAP